MDVDGNVTEGPGFNVGIVSNGKIYTADKNVLKGITMTVVEDIADENRLAFARKSISKFEFMNADEVFITSSSGGVTATQKSGPITELLINKYKDKMEEYATDLN
jgi:branched-chain amino acid aminotransferase